jgi:hypothetical protein
MPFQCPEGHSCQCHGCAPGEFPPNERLGVGHFSVRFQKEVLLLQPFLNDQQVDSCSEAMCGVDGFVVAYSLLPACILAKTAAKALASTSLEESSALSRYQAIGGIDDGRQTAKTDSAETYPGESG